MSITGQFINANLEGSFLIVVVILLRTLFLNRVPKKLFMLFWEIVLLRFLWIFELDFFHINTIPIAPVLVPPVLNRTGHMNGVPWQNLMDKSAPAHIGEVLFCIWLAGALILLGSVIHTHHKSRKQYREAIPVSTASLNTILVENGLGRRVQVKISDTVSSPFVYGFIRPVILFPFHIDLEEDTTKYILTHEIAHIKNHDMWKKSILIAVVSLYWFNPLVWILFILMNRDMELVCDEAVIRKYGASHNYIYASLLLSLEEKKNGFHPSYIGIGKHSIKERIEVIMKKQKISAICIGIAAISILTAVGITLYSNVTWYAESAKDAASENEAAYTKAELEAMEMHNQAINEEAQESLSVYEKFGLSYDSKEDQIYLNGSPVRYFEDNIADDGSFLGTQLWCKNGTGVPMLSTMKRTRFRKYKNTQRTNWKSI